MKLPLDMTPGTDSNGTEIAWTTYVLCDTPTTTAAQATSTGAAIAAVTVTEATGCHAHGSSYHCTVGDALYKVEGTIDVGSAPEEFTSCHHHGEVLYVYQLAP